MASKSDLRGAVASLRSTLIYGLDANFSDPLYRRWRQTLDHAVLIGNRVVAWNALADANAAYAAIYRKLVDATHALETEESDADLIAALDRADAALGEVDALLG